MKPGKKPGKAGNPWKLQAHQPARAEIGWKSRVEKLVPVLRSWNSQECLEIFLTSHESLEVDSKLVWKVR